MPSDASHAISGSASRPEGPDPVLVGPEQDQHEGEDQQRATDETQHRHARRHEARAVHQVAQHQAVPEAHDESGPELEGPVVDGHQGVALCFERGGLGATRRGPGLVHVDHRDDADEADRDEDRLHDASGDVSERDGCALSLHERVDDDRGCDVEGDHSELEDRAELQARVGDGPGGEARVGPAGVEPIDEEEPGWDAGDERADEEPAEDPSGSPSVESRRIQFRPPSCVGSKSYLIGRKWGSRTTGPSSDGQSAADCTRVRP